jgi:hypothetical protein
MAARAAASQKITVAAGEPAQAGALPAVGAPGYAQARIEPDAADLVGAIAPP